MIPCIAEHIGQRSRTDGFEANLDAIVHSQIHPAGRTSTAALDYNALNDDDALQLYIWGTALAISALQPRFLPPHYVRLSQFFKSHGVGALVTRLLSRVGLCCSDKSRWSAEQRVVQRCGDEELISKDVNLAISAA